MFGAPRSAHDFIAFGADRTLRASEEYAATIVLKAFLIRFVVQREKLAVRKRGKACRRAAMAGVKTI
jgi:hypothetical protein